MDDRIYLRRYTYSDTDSNSNSYSYSYADTDTDPNTYSDPDTIQLPGLCCRH